MLQEALQFLSDKFSRADSARVVTLPDDSRHVFIDQGGVFTKHELPPPLRKHTVASVEDLVAAANRWKDSPVAWLSGEAIVLVTDDSDRRDIVTLPLVKSAAFTKLMQLDKTPQLDQAQLIRLLRIDLQGTANRTALLTAIRSIKFKSVDSGASSIQHGNESLGRAIENEVTGAGDIPEQVLVECAVFANHGERDKRFKVACDLEIVASEKKFRFHPLPDDLERVTDAALDDIREQIAADLPGVPVFFGSP